MEARVKRADRTRAGARLRARSKARAAWAICAVAALGAAVLPGAAQETARGDFTTAAEVRPILSATRGNWVAVRRWQGQDLLYATHILAWRCGLAALEVGVNGAAPSPWPLPPCHKGTAAPNALRAEDGPLFRAYPEGSLREVTVQVTYADGSREEASFDRAAIAQD